MKLLEQNSKLKSNCTKDSKFRQEQPENLSEGGSYCKRDVGNVTAKTEITFEYENKADEELKAMGIDLENIKEIPFQACISYISSEGHKLLRVITKKQKATHEQVKAEQHANMEILASNAVQQQAGQAFIGNHNGSEELGKKWGNYMQQNVLLNQANNQEAQQRFDLWSNQNAVISKASSNQLARKSKPQQKQQQQVNQPKSGGFFSNIGSYFGVGQQPSSMSNAQPAQMQSSPFGGGQPLSSMSNSRSAQMQFAQKQECKAPGKKKERLRSMDSASGDSDDEQKQECRAPGKKKERLRSMDSAGDSDDDAEVIFKFKNNK